MNAMKRLWSLHRRQIKGIAGVSALFLGLQALYINASPVNPGNSVAAHQKKFAQGHILVQPKAGLSDDNFDHILNKHGASKKSKIDKINVHLINVAPGQEESAVAELAQDPNIKFAELDQVIEGNFTSNDPYLGSEWHIPKINAPSAWDYSIGSGVTIAILDSGVDGTHPDLAPNMVPGYNVYNNNTDTSDICGHGTAVAGTAAAVNNNATGVSGVAGQSKIMPIKIAYVDSTGACYAYLSTMASGVTYAADHGARIVNLSYSSVPGSSTVLSAAQYLMSKGGLLFVSAGNSGTDLGYTPQTTMIIVSATDSGDNMASFSSFGNWVTLSAPGAGIYTTNRGGGYGGWNGTSFASPAAAGVGALMMSANPSLSASQIQSLLYSSSVDLGAAGRDAYFGYGRVNAAAAVLAARNAIAPTDTQAPTVSIASPAGGSTVSGLASISVSASDNVGVARVDLKVNGNVVASDSASPYTFSWDSKTVADGTASLVAVAYDAAGNQASSSAVSIKVANTVAPPPATDTTPPTVQITSPTVASTISGNSVTVNVSASDNSGAAGISLTLSIDGVVKAQATGGSMSYNWNIRKLKTGAHTIQVTARDAAGNSSSATTQVNK